ncbi:pyridoxal phosphate-dependent aminotransferase [Pseudomonas sp. GD03862]|uniref:pyridoxal phosphate-dependent aminotransferase n=1 Tax=Pseudomonas sp. GD03862 TaxID=2975391 RepID=UPI00244B2EAE|nr:pyridoxal phosphate-dependent aminotransferase [Pseudomonas sp. GD03862]MDH0704951.1 pyridoxal phosphate-dependent aminotransferase [Pseudomonas sp. GD03862]
MPVTLNRFLQAARPSATYEVMDRVAARRAEGASIISLSSGEPDFDTPPHVSEAGIADIKAGHTRYTQVAGLQQLREAAAEKFQRENGLQVDWRNTLVSRGGKQVIFNALAATLNEGDQVIVPAPYWVSYPEIVQLCGGEPVIVPCTAHSNFKLTAEALEAVIGPRTRWLILNSPSNPSGAVYSREELEAFTLAQVTPLLAERVLTMNGVSKAYAMTGWRIGYATGPAWLIKAMEKLQGQQTSGPCTISQRAALAALTGPKDFIRLSRVIFQQRRDQVLKWLADAPGLRCEVPQGAFYVFACCAELLGKVTPKGTVLRSDEDVVNALLDEADVALVHGSAFGLGPYIRIAYALNDDSLHQACDAIVRFCCALRSA